MLPTEFTARMQRLLGAEYPDFAAAWDRPRAVALRLNRLKTKTPPALSQYALRPVPWAADGYYYDPDARPGLSPLHEAGLYYLQEASAMAPAGLLDVRPGQRVLDLCAAPGGKSGQLAAALDGEGLLVANEINPSRAKILSRNLERLGVANALVLNEHPQRLAERLPEFFDKVLVDAPCSGEGMFRKEDAAVQDWSPETVSMCARRQLEILRSAARLLAPGGRLVYSTCTFAPEENEGVLSEFLRENPDFTVDGEAPWFSPGRPDWVENGDPSLTRAFRLWPHKLLGEGHFAAVLEKAGEGKQNAAPQTLEALPKEAAAFLAEVDAALPLRGCVRFGDMVYLAPPELPELKGLKVLRPGLALGSSRGSRFIPAHALALYLKTAAQTADYPADDPALRRYLAGDVLPSPLRGWTLVTVDGLSLGWARGSDGMLKNHFPKGLRVPFRAPL